MSYRIKRVAALTGINAATLRAWERRYQLIQPRRTPSGYRLYSESDVAMLAQLKRLTDQGLTIGEAIEQVKRGGPAVAPDAPETEMSEVRDLLLDCLLAMDRPGAVAAYDRLAHVAPLRRTEEVLLPLMRTVGDLWEQGVTGVAEEHFACGFVREKMASILEGLERAARDGREAVCAGFPGEPHELGLLAAAIRLRSEGWHVVYLGLEVPYEELRRVLAARRPQLFCTSVILAQRPEQFRKLAELLRDVAPADTRVVIGGRGVPARTAEVAGVMVTNLMGDLATTSRIRLS